MTAISNNSHKEFFRNSLIVGYFVGLATIFISGFSTTTSPFFISLGWDSAIFRLIGVAMKTGKSLYVDIFDHKGPVLFFIEYLGQVVHGGRGGIFLLQILFLFGTLSLVYLIARLFLQRNFAWILPGMYVFLLTNFYQWGNLSEEYSMFFCFIAVYLLLKNLLNNDRKYQWLELMLSGCALGLVVFLRMNNAASIVAVAIAYLLSLVFAKKWKNVYKQSAMFISGFVITTVVIVAVFLALHSLPEMIYATFLFNIKYSEFSIGALPELAKTGYIFWASLGLIVGIVGSALNYYLKKEIWVSLSVVLVSLFTFVAVMLSTTGYFHYLQLILMPMSLGAILIIYSLPSAPRKLIRYSLYVIGIIFVLVVVNASINNINDYRTGQSGNYLASSKGADTDYANNAKLIVGNIPEFERDDIFGYNIPASFYLATGLVPSFRYFTLQDWWGQHDPGIYRELEGIFEHNPPKWVLVADGPIADKRISLIIQQRYIMNQKIDKVRLFHLR